MSDKEIVITCMTKHLEWLEGVISVTNWDIAKFMHYGPDDEFSDVTKVRTVQDEYIDSLHRCERKYKFVKKTLHQVEKYGVNKLIPVAYRNKVKGIGYDDCHRALSNYICRIGNLQETRMTYVAYILNAGIDNFKCWV